MAFRDLVAGGGGCSVPGEGSSSSSNPLGALANSLLGSAAKTQERVRELPSLSRPGGSGPGALLDGSLAGLPGIPGTEVDVGPSVPLRPPHVAREFLDAFQGIRPGPGPGPSGAGFEEAWEAAVGPAGLPGLYPGGPAVRPGLLPEERLREAQFEEFERIFGAPPSAGPAAGRGEPIPGGSVSHPGLSTAIRSFFNTARGPAPFVPQQHQQLPPLLPLSEGDSARIRNRSSILARHVFADQGEGFADAQVNVFLHSLGISPGPAARLAADGTFAGRFADFEDVWQQGGKGPLLQQQQPPPPQLLPRGHSTGWAEEFEQQQGSAGPATDSLPGAAWASEFQELASRPPPLASAAGDQLAAQQAGRLADVLAGDADPKFQNSKFLEFVSKMGRGELVAEDGALKPGVGPAQPSWVDEFEQLHHHQHHDLEAPSWAAEFQSSNQAALQGGDAAGADWADEFGDQMSRGILDGVPDEDAAGWLDSYNRFVEEQLKGELDLRQSGGARWSYAFADNNPYVGHPDPFHQGRQLYDKGLLSESVLALEAEVLKNDGNADAWHLLGVVHAENDDDRQAIAAMARARDADPTNLNVLLSLGVSHTNELEQAEALAHLRSWLQHNPKYSALLPRAPEGAAPPQMSQSEIVSTFVEAARLAPEDPDIQEVLGVLFNLSREFGRAKEAFGRALALRPGSHTLWNRLGATQANNAESGQAITAYQKALDLKPNYVRAWTNMGIAFANQGKYEESARFYVRALSMNPTADNVWQYLRIALSGANRQDQWGLCDRREIESLQKEFPL